MTITISLNPAVIGAIAAGLLIFSWAFNQWIDARDHAAAEKADLTGQPAEDSADTAWLVVIGVLATLAGVAVVSWVAALITLGGFLVAGPIMVWGDHRRAVRRIKRQAERQARLEQHRMDVAAAAILEKTDDR